MNVIKVYTKLYKLYMLEHHRIDVSEGIDINKTNASK